MNTVSHPLLDPEEALPLEVLHLEDNEIDALIFKQAAERCSRPLVVTTVATVSEFKDALPDRQPHLICADHILPDGIALEAIAFSKETFPDVPFMVITGAGEEEVVAEYLRAGAADYISKKKLDLLPMALDSVIERYRDKALRERAEQETLRINEELLALIRRVEEERDGEKRALSRDIHDQLGQELTALKLGLFWIQGKLKNITDPKTMQSVNDKIQALIDLNTSTIKSVRNLAHSLRPVVLDQLGLSAGLESLVRDFNLRGHCFCGLHCNELPALSEGKRTDIFRIVQESLTNISRHAEASLAYVRLQIKGTGLLLEIGDNGKGMDSMDEIKGFNEGLGLVGLRERARNHKGIIELDTAPGKGTSLSIYFPNVHPA